MLPIPKPSAIATPELPKGWYKLSLKILRGGRLAIIGTNIDIIANLRKARQNQTTSNPKIFSRGTASKIWVFDGEALYDGTEFNLKDPFPIIDQFSDGRWLVAYSRSDGNANTLILDTRGNKLNRLELGDGIEHIKIDDNDRVWVGWFDEGVYGNDNWNLPNQKWPPSSAGMAAFDTKGSLIESWKGHIIDDCYSLNVFGKEVWACTYSDFPILRIDSTYQESWKSGLSGIKAIAVDYPHVIAAGGYKDDFNKLHLLRLEKKNATIKNSWRIPQLEARPTSLQLLDGRADCLHVVSNNVWYQWQVSQFIN